MSFTLFGRIRVRRCNSVPRAVARDSEYGRYLFWEQRLARLAELLAGSE
jgi:hypothetical protein